MRALKLAFGLCLITVAGCQTAPATDADADARIEQVLTHFIANPIAEKPVTQHPVKPHLIFSRHFNISLSARAYLQLMTDPTKDAVSSELLQEVAQYYLDHPEEIPDPDATYWAGEYHSAAVAKFGINGTVRKGALNREAELKMLEYMVSYLNFWSRLDHYEFSLKHQTYYYWNSENHWWQEIVTAWGYLLALKDDPDFKNTILHDGKTIQEHYDTTVFYMKEHMRQRVKKGFFTEISSGGYAGRMHNMYYTIYEISPDPDLRALASKTLDLWWVFWAEEQILGERGGGKVRHRRLRGLLPYSDNHMTPAWYYLGIGPRDMEYIKGLQDDSVIMAMNYMALLSDYRPAPIVEDILKDRESAPAYTITQRRVGRSAGQDETVFSEVKRADPEKYENAGIEKHKFYDFENGGVLKYSWVSPNFILGTNMRPPYNAKAWVAGSAQGWWHGLLLRGDNPEYPERIVPTAIYPRDSMGEQYAIQSKTSFMTRKLNDVWSKVTDNSKFPMGVFLSKGLEDYTKFKGDFIFVDSPEVWAAVRAVESSFVPSNETLQKKHKVAGNFYRLTNDTQPIIIEVAEAGSYRSFEAFQEAVQNAQITYEDGAYHYASLSGDRFSMFDDRSAPQVNNQVINYAPSQAYDSRYISSVWDSGIVTITAGGETHVLDFTVN